MGKLVVAWYDNKGVQYNASTLFDTETGKFYDWDGKSGTYIEREAD